MNIIDLYKPNHLIIKWRLTYDCNYHCSYCIQEWLKSRQLEFDMKETAKKINNLVSKSPFNKAEVGFVGGEVSLLDLKTLQDLMPNVTSFSITTNLSAPVDYYNSLRNLYLIASYHYEFVDLDEFVDKFDKIQVDKKKIEVVLTEDNKEQVYRLVEICKKKGFYIQVDEDRRIQTKLQTAPTSIKIPRIKVEFDDGKEEYFNTKFDMLYDKRINTNSKNAFIAKGMKCSQGYDFIHIMGDKIWDCGGDYTLDNYTFHYNICKSGCTLCGRISLYG